MRPADTDTETQTLPDRRLTGITTWVLVKMIRRMDVHCCYILKLPFSQNLYQFTKSSRRARWRGVESTDGSQTKVVAHFPPSDATKC